MKKLVTLTSFLLLTGSIFAMDMAGMGSVLQTVAGGASDFAKMQQQQNAQNKEFQNKQREEQGQLNQQQMDSQQNSAYNQIGGMTNRQNQSGYPILDPYANPGYWNARSTQFQNSMGMAEKRSQMQNEAAQRAMEQELEKTKMMMKMIGGMMEKAGDQMMKSGEAAQKAKKEKNGAFLAQCKKNPSSCDYNEETGEASYKTPDGKVHTQKMDSETWGTFKQGGADEKNQYNIEFCRKNPFDERCKNLRFDNEVDQLKYQDGVQGDLKGQIKDKTKEKGQLEKEKKKVKDDIEDLQAEREDAIANGKAHSVLDTKLKRKQEELTSLGEEITAISTEITNLQASSESLFTGSDSTQE
jgi:type II secretory pathway pseudopilin PulG